MSGEIAKQGAGATAETASSASGTSQEPPNKKPKLSTPWDRVLPGNDAAEDAMITMQHVIPEVLQKLPAALTAWAGTCNAHVVKKGCFA